MLSWIFGEVKSNKVHLHTHDRAAGFLEFEKAKVRWFLSINSATLPQEARNKGMNTYRAITIENEIFEFSGGFTDLHTKSYEHILTGNGFRMNDARTAINIVHDIRQGITLGLIGDYHPLCKLPLQKHPFER